jgi:MoxR-like ATPase
MGNGKTSVLQMLAKALPTHVPCYVDCTTKDLGDIMMPKFKSNGEQDYVSFVPNEEFGLHIKDKPIIIDLDEFGKTEQVGQDGINQANVLERQLGSNKLHPDSIIFATTNKGSEGVGDMLEAHQRNRMILVNVRKSTNTEWLAWGLNNGITRPYLVGQKIHHSCFTAFEDVKNPDDNPYIFHPNQQRTAFVTPRSAT